MSTVSDLEVPMVSTIDHMMLFKTLSMFFEIAVVALIPILAEVVHFI